MVREIITEWTGLGSSPKLSIMYFLPGSASVQSQRADLGNLWDDLLPLMSNETSYVIQNTGRELNVGSGILESLWADSAVHDGVGGSAVESVPDATQALIRWRTTGIIQGRLLQGRTFLPGFSANTIVAGNLSTGAQATINAALQAFIAANSGFAIWHRPKNGVGGSAVAVSAGSAWSEFAVQRKRRG